MIGEDADTFRGIAFHLDFSGFNLGDESFDSGADAECQTVGLIVPGVLNERHKIVSAAVSVAPLGTLVQKIHTNDETSDHTCHTLVRKFFPVLFEGTCKFLDVVIVLPKDVTKRKPVLEFGELGGKEFGVPKHVVKHKENQTDFQFVHIGCALDDNRDFVFCELGGYLLDV